MDSARRCRTGRLALDAQFTPAVYAVQIGLERLDAALVHLYGALPLLCFAAYDETRSETLTRLMPLLILAAGAVFYMRLENPWHRFASLVGGFTFGWLALMLHLGWYWNGRQEYWMAEPGTWTDTFNWTSRFGATLMLILVAPVLVELLRLVLTSVRIPRPPLQKPSGD